MPKAGLIIPDRNDAVLLRMIVEHEGFWERGTELRESGKTEETDGFDSACDALRDQIRVTQPRDVRRRDSAARVCCSMGRSRHGDGGGRRSSRDRQWR
jgi:hypothetical protein